MHLSVAPAVVVSPKTTTVTEGNNVTLTCNVTGDPKPSIKWTKIGEEHVVLSENASLTITNITRVPRNILQYQCTASNGVENPASQIADINVECEYF